MTHRIALLAMLAAGVSYVSLAEIRLLQASPSRSVRLVTDAVAGLPRLRFADLFTFIGA